jgi:sortase (surface protein transpeptidase)
MAALAALLAATGGPLTLGVLRAEAQPPAPPPTRVISDLPGFAPDRIPGRRQATSSPVLPRSVPVRLDIPAIGVHTDLMPLGLHRDGTVEVPPLDADAPAGWYRHSVTPGEVGSAVILGHVDSARDGPAVFYRLGTLNRGDRVSVRRADRTVATFFVDSVNRTPKSDFPTAGVYGESSVPILHLITCGGAFDRRRGVYRDNVIVAAHYSGSDEETAN